MGFVFLLVPGANGPPPGMSWEPAPHHGEFQVSNSTLAWQA
jgi:hypothetical protein